MAVRRLAASPDLGIERFASFEEFRPNEVIGGGLSVPKDPRNSSAVRAILPFRDSLLVLQRSFARRLETNIGADHGLGMVIPLSFEATINGRTFDNSVIAITRGKTPSVAIEEHPNTYLMVRFNSDMRKRGWADFDRGLHPVAVLPDRLEHVRAVILEIFQFASTDEDIGCEGIRQAMQETLIAALDTVLATESVRRGEHRSFERYRRLIEDLDEIVSLQPAIALYSEQLSRTLQVSVRTLQNAAQTVHGMSLHRYLASKRLWSVRRQLIKGHPTTTVRAAAFANGYWHMGEFSRSYKVAFGEQPSETLGRARRFRVF